MKPLHPSNLVPPGFQVLSAVSEGSLTTIVIRSTSAFSRCPGCRRACRRIVDLPMAGRSVALVATVRRFRCESVLCGRTIFAERFAPDVLAPWARRTARLEGLVHHLGLVLGGRPGARFAKRLMLAVSNDTLLRTVRRHGCPPVQSPTVIGIDDWAWRRNHRYGTLICDLERRRPIGLLPDREPSTAQAWLSHQPQIASIARDRGGAYALAAARALPHAAQVADRWHLMANASHVFLEAVRKSMRQIRTAIGVMTVDPTLLTAVERIQDEGYLRREDANAAVFGLAKDGVPIKEIVRRTGHSRGLVRQILRGHRGDMFRIRESSLEAHLPWLDGQWSTGHRNAAELWRRLKEQGFKGSLRVVTEWATRQRRADRTGSAILHRIPSSRTIARLMTTSRDTLSKAETATVAAVEAGVPLLIEAREIIAAFHQMIRRKAEADLLPWIERSRTSLVAPFANGVQRDIDAFRAAIVTNWSSGQTEGQITKLKLVKRQMYGRGKLDLLQAQVIGSG